MGEKRGKKRARFFSTEVEGVHFHIYRARCEKTNLLKEVFGKVEGEPRQSSLLKPYTLHICESVSINTLCTMETV